VGSGAIIEGVRHSRLKVTELLIKRLLIQIVGSDAVLEWDLKTQPTIKFDCACLNMSQHVRELRYHFS